MFSNIQLPMQSIIPQPRLSQSEQVYHKQFKQTPSIFVNESFIDIIEEPQSKINAKEMYKTPQKKKQGSQQKINNDQLLIECIHLCNMEQIQKILKSTLYPIQQKQQTFPTQEKIVIDSFFSSGIKRLKKTKKAKFQHYNNKYVPNSEPIKKKPKIQHDCLSYLGKSMYSFSQVKHGQLFIEKTKKQPEYQVNIIPSCQVDQSYILEQENNATKIMIDSQTNQQLMKKLLFQDPIQNQNMPKSNIFLQGKSLQFIVGNHLMINLYKNMENKPEIQQLDPSSKAYTPDQLKYIGCIGNKYCEKIMEQNFRVRN